MTFLEGQSTCLFTVFDESLQYKSAAHIFFLSSIKSKAISRDILAILDKYKRLLIFQVSIIARPLLLPQPKHPPPRPQASESPDQQDGRAQAGRLRLGQGLRDSRPLLLGRGRHLVVSPARCLIRGEALLDVDRHVVGRVYFRR